MSQYDILIKNGSIVDGLGGDPYIADVGISDGVITEIGKIAGLAKQVIDAEGHIVTPGWVDIHTHLDGQVTWDDALSPSFEHGVTTIVMGNCGVGFAPVRPNGATELIDIMEGVEDIPGTALYDGVPWGKWETFPQYLDFLSSRSFTADVAAQIPHSALRAYVLGARDAYRNYATKDEIAEMARLVEEGMEAGAVGISTNRTTGHAATSGNLVPGTFASHEELFALVKAMLPSRNGVVQIIPSGVIGPHDLGRPADEYTMLDEVEMMADLSRETGRKVSFSLSQYASAPDEWRDVLKNTQEANGQGAQLFAQVAARPTGVLSSLTTYHALQLRETYLKLKSLPLEERVREMRRPEVKAAILSDRDVPDPNPGSNENFTQRLMDGALYLTYPLGEAVDYEPPLERSVASLAEQRGETMHSVLYDLLLEEDGNAMLIVPWLNYVEANHDAIHDMLTSPVTLTGLGDAGAHVRWTCDASIPTYTLTHWVRDRSRGSRMTLPFAVRKMSSLNAAFYGMTDRGEITVGKRADINVIDLDRLALQKPRLVYDLPTGAGRMNQPSSGYKATIVNGVPTRIDDQDTGLRPGRLYRGH